MLPSGGDPRRDTAAFWEAGDSPPPCTARGRVPAVSAPRVFARIHVPTLPGGLMKGAALQAGLCPLDSHPLPPPQMPTSALLQSPGSSGQVLIPCGWFFLKARRTQTHTGMTT